MSMYAKSRFPGYFPLCPAFHFASDFSVRPRLVCCRPCAAATVTAFQHTCPMTIGSASTVEKLKEVNFHNFATGVFYRVLKLPILMNAMTDWLTLPVPTLQIINGKYERERVLGRIAVCLTSGSHTYTALTTHDQSFSHHICEPTLSVDDSGHNEYGFSFNYFLPLNSTRLTHEI